MEPETALEEVCFWQARYLKGDRAGATRMDFRMLLGTLEGAFLDLRLAKIPGLYAADDYSAGQRFAREHRASERGLAYASVRAAAGNCVVGFRPETVRDLKHHHQVVMSWDGSRMTL
jgi:hypothetical protein